MKNMAIEKQEEISREVQSDYNVVDNLNYHIVPFAFSDNYTSLCYKLNMSERWDEEDINSNNLLHHIKNFVSKDENKSIGSKFKLSKNSKIRESVGITERKTNYLTMKIDDHGKKEEYHFMIEEVELYIFETGIGFVIYEVEFGKNKKKEKDINKIINGNHYLRKDKLRGKKIYLNKPIHNPKNKSTEYQQIEFEKRKFVKTLLNSINVSTYFVDIENFKENLIFSSIVLDREIENGKLGEYLFAMRRGMQIDSKVGKNDFMCIGDNEVIQLFSGSYWGASLEGVANIVYCDFENKNNSINKFLDGSYKSNVKQMYFPMYIIALMKRYSLLLFSIEAGDLPNKLESYVDENDKTNINKIRRLKERIIFFNLRCVFSDISNLTHQAQLLICFQVS